MARCGQRGGRCATRSCLIALLTVWNMRGNYPRTAGLAHRESARTRAHHDFTSPTLRAGPLDVSVLVQDVMLRKTAAGLPTYGQPIRVLIRSEINAPRDRRGHQQNFCMRPVEACPAGTWHIEVVVDDFGRSPRSVRCVVARRLPWLDMTCGSAGRLARSASFPSGSRAFHHWSGAICLPKRPFGSGLVP